MAPKKNYRDILSRVDNGLDLENTNPFEMIVEALGNVGYANSSAQEILRDMYVLRATPEGENTRVERLPMGAYMNGFLTQTDGIPPQKDRKKTKVVEGAALGDALLSGKLYFHDKEFNRIYALGLSNENPGQIVAYEDKNGYIPTPPEKPSLIKRILSVIGIFRDEVNQYRKDLAEYNQVTADMRDQESFNEANAMIREDLHMEKEARKQAAARELKGPQIKVDFERQMGDLDKILASRPNASKSNFLQGKLYVLAETNPVRIAVSSMLKTAVEAKFPGFPLDRDAYAGPAYVPSLRQFGLPLYGRDYANNSEKYPGCLRALSEIFPADGTPTQSEVTEFFNTFEEAADAMERGTAPDRKSLDAIKEILTKSIDIVRSDFKNVGITEDTPVSAATPHIIQVLETAAENTRRAEMTGKLAGMLAGKCGPDSPDYKTLKEIQETAAGLQKFCETCRELDGDIKEPFAMSGKPVIQDLTRYGVSNPFGELRDAERSGEKDPEKLRRLTANVVVSAMGESSPWPDAAARDMAAAQLAKNEDFRKLVDNCPGKLSDAVRDKAFLQQVSQAFSADQPSRQPQLQPRQPQMQAEAAPQEPAPMGM